jgi:exosortase D (VPLPA-CTERM-specific)
LLSQDPQMTRRATHVYVVLIASALVLLYRHVLAKLVFDWWTDENYSHGFLIIPIAAYLVWERRDGFAATPNKPSRAGLLVIVASILVLLAGILGSELFLTRISLVGTLAGSALFLFGWQRLRVLAFPLSVLFLMIPIPAILFNQIAFPLQLLASRTGEAGLRSLEIPVLREGNVLILASTSLEVAEACSGIRSLVALFTLAIMFGYFADRRGWVRAVIALSTIPVAIVANAARVAGTGVAAHFYGPAAAEGFLHEFSGWLVFVFAFLLMLALQRAIGRFWPDGNATTAPPRIDAHRSDVGATGPTSAFALRRCLALCACLVASAGLVARAERPEPTPARLAFAQFPMQIGDWRGIQEPALDPDILKVLGVDDYLTRAYFSPERAGVGLYIGYYGSQRQGDTMHSPLNCLPGSGWEPLSRTSLPVAVANDSPGGAGSPILINRYVIQKGLDRQLVLYWYQSHGRVVANEYWGKLFLIHDAVRLNRTDGSLVRVIVPVGGENGETRAEELAVRFVKALFPVLGSYLPA